LVVALLVRALPPALVAAPWVITAPEIPLPLATLRTALLAPASVPLAAVARTALLAPWRFGLVHRRSIDDRRGEIALRFGNHPLAELVAQHARTHLLDRAFAELAQLEWAERDADQPVHLQAEVAQHVAHLAVLALADREGEPDVRPFGRRAVERRLDRAVV